MTISTSAISHAYELWLPVFGAKPAVACRQAVALACSINLAVAMPGLPTAQCPVSKLEGLKAWT